MIKYNESVPLDQIMYGQYIRYEFLDTMTQLEFAGSDAEQVNVFIDLYEMLLPLYRFLNTNNGTEIIASTILNMVTHYRKYFWRMNVEAKIIFVYSTLLSNNITRFVSEYNSKYRLRILNNTLVGDKVDVALSLVKMMVPYMPLVYFKQGTVEPAVMIKHMVQTVPLFQECPNIVISSSEYTYTLPAYCPNTVVYRKKYDAKKKVNTAYSYNAINAINAFAYETRKLVIDHAILPLLMPCIMTVSGIPKKNVQSTKDIVTTIKMVEHIPAEIIPNMNALFDWMSEYCREHKQKMMPRPLFADRWRAIYIEYQYLLYQQLPESKEEEYLLELQDPSAVRYINGTYFPNYPINFQGV